MSTVHNFILLCYESDEPGDDGCTSAVRHVNADLAETNFGRVAFKPVHEYAGGYKALEAHVYLYAGNCQELGELCEAMRNAAWEDAAAVQLLMKGDHEEIWRFIDWRNEPVPVDDRAEDTHP